MSTSRAVRAGTTIGILAAAAESLRPSLTPRSTLHQGLVTGMMATTGAAIGTGAGALVRRLTGREGRRFGLPAAAVLATGGVAALHGHRLAAAQRASYEEWGGGTGNPALGAAAGAAVAAGLTAATSVGSRELRMGSAAAAERFAGPPVLWSAAGTTAAAAVLTGIGRISLQRVLDGLARSGRAPDTALADPIDDPHVSGGPGSAVPYDTLSREGRRFVHWRVSAQAMRDTGLGATREPVRVFVGLDSAPSVSDRVELALAELERLGAFDRAVLIAVSPAGTGYANSVPVEALEMFTGGNCASVVVQYGVLPSMFSTGKVPLAAQTFRLLLDRINERVARQPPESRTRVVIYGESLGAEAAQHGLLQKPSLVDLGSARVAEIDAALFVGTPGGPSLRDDLLDHPGTVHVDRWQALPDPLPHGCQLWFLEHDADPVTRFSRALITRKPRWLAAEPRGRNIPAAMRWVPIATWQQVLFDVAYATQAQSGVFRSVGHDYRADLAPLVAAAFAPDARELVDRVQALLADREVNRDRMLAAAEGDAG